MSFYITTDEDLLKAIKADISIETARSIVAQYLNVRFIYFTNPDVEMNEKAALIKSVQDFIARFKDVNRGDTPMFLFQKTLDFHIQDLYNHDE